MKKVLLVTTIVSGLLTACADTAKNETVNSTDSIQINSADGTAATSLDSTKAAEEKRVKDSADAAHGHSH